MVERRGDCGNLRVTPDCPTQEPTEAIVLMTARMSGAVSPI